MKPSVAWWFGRAAEDGEVRVRLRGLVIEISISFAVLRYDVVRMADSGAWKRQVVTHWQGVCVVCSRREAILRRVL